MTQEISKAPGRGRSGSMKRAWMLMATEGGRWSASEVAERLGQDMHSHLQRMVECGYAKKYTGSGRCNAVRFGVDEKCKVPVGVTIKELMEAAVVVAA
jgi:hypothetical protein